MQRHTSDIFQSNSGFNYRVSEDLGISGINDSNDSSSQAPYEGNTVVPQVSLATTPGSIEFSSSISGICKKRTTVVEGSDIIEPRPRILPTYTMSVCYNRHFECRLGSSVTRVKGESSVGKKRQKHVNLKEMTSIISALKIYIISGCQDLFNSS